LPFGERLDASVRPLKTTKGVRNEHRKIAAVPDHRTCLVCHNAVRDLAPVLLVSSTPLVLVVHPSVPAKTVKDLIALAKAKPDQLNYASPGSGTTSHLAAELMKTMTGTKMTHIPYKGSGGRSRSAARRRNSVFTSSARSKSTPW
jgi:tripartite-type tricarboxylate transporter receptor subunit TctC